MRRREFIALGRDGSVANCCEGAVASHDAGDRVP